MKVIKQFGRVVGALCFFGSLLCASSIDPQCSSVLTSMVAIGGGPGGTATTFCVSDYGWSNGWFATSTPGDFPANQPNNLLADSGQYLSYTYNGQTYGSWLTPNVEGRNTGSKFSIVTPVSIVPGTNNQEAQSVITDGRVNITITSQVIDNNIRQTFLVTDTTSASLTNVKFAEYFNYFPYGEGNNTKGTLTYQTVPTLENTSVLGLWADGNWMDPGFIRAGGVCGGVGTAGCTTPNQHEVGTPSSVFTDVNLGANLNGTNSANNNAAGALAWTVSSIGSGQTQAFTLELVPEPETIALMALGLVGILIGRRKFKRN